MKYIALTLIVIMIILVSRIDEQVVVQHTQQERDILFRQSDLLDTVNLDDNILVWYSAKEDVKFETILGLIKNSNRTVRLIYTSSDVNKAVEEVAAQMINVKNCVDTLGKRYYYEFDKDVEVGSVIINCFARNKMFD